MADIIFRSEKALRGLGLFYLMMVLVQKGTDAYDFKVGGSNGWSVPSYINTNSYNQWAETNRFQIGDSLVFDYKAGQDSVLYVNSDDYNNCNIGSPIEKYTDGHTMFKLDHSGPHHFISGNRDNCLKNEKLLVVVLADRRNSNSSYTNQNKTSPPSPSPSGPTEASGPSPPSPSPTPPPAGQESPSPYSSPPTAEVEINPTPAPAREPPPPNKASASSIWVSFTGLFGAFMASSFVLTF